MSDKTTRSARQSSLTKRDQIMCEATRQFNELGYHDTRLEDIADVFGVGKTSIHYHFKSKEKLLATVYQGSFALIEGELKVAANAPNGLERAMAFIRAHLQAHVNGLAGGQPPLACFNDLDGLEGEDRSALGARYRAYVYGFRRFLKEGIADGSVAVQSLEASTFFVFNALQAVPEWLEAIPERRRDDAVDGFCDLMRFGLNGRSHPPTLPSLSRNNAFAMPAIFDRETRNKLKQEAFLRTGIRFLNKKGYRNLSLEDIAAELGVTRGAFYYHIADKEALLLQAFERTCGLMEESLDISAKKGGLDSFTALLCSLRWLFEGHLTELDPLIRLELIHLLDKRQKMVISARLRALRAHYAELIARGIVDGSVRAIDLDASEYLVFGTLFAATGRRLAATHLAESWSADDEPVTASMTYFEPLISGLSA